MKFRTNEASRLKKRLQALTQSISEQQSKVAQLTDEVLERVPANQKLVIQEIISAAKKKDLRGRRYTDEFIMLCMIMNIRSQSNYNFLRNENIIPLPCTKTIRDYMSLMGSDCGFDEDFFKLLKKSFESKDIMNRHGVITLDEINLRKSVAVSARNLTYSGLTDFGNDGPQSCDIKEQATHGLVLQFQSLTDKYTQPIAVFASQSAVKGEDLARLVLKAICLLENAGALIHGVISDGASTNRKMWKILQIDSSIDGLKTYFPHPLDDKRKVFIFSDTPHLIKCVRNRLYDKQYLRVRNILNY